MLRGCNSGCCRLFAPGLRFVQRGYGFDRWCARFRRRPRGVRRLVCRDWRRSGDNRRCPIDGRHGRVGWCCGFGWCEHRWQCHRWRCHRWRCHRWRCRWRRRRGGNGRRGQVRRCRSGGRNDFRRGRVWKRRRGDRRYDPCRWDNRDRRGEHQRRNDKCWRHQTRRRHSRGRHDVNRWNERHRRDESHGRRFGQWWRQWWRRWWIHRTARPIDHLYCRRLDRVDLRRYRGHQRSGRVGTDAA